MGQAVVRIACSAQLTTSTQKNVIVSVGLRVIDTGRKVDIKHAMAGDQDAITRLE